MPAILYCNVKNILYIDLFNSKMQWKISFNKCWDQFSLKYSTRCSNQHTRTDDIFPQTLHQKSSNNLCSYTNCYYFFQFLSNQCFPHLLQLRTVNFWELSMEKDLLQARSPAWPSTNNNKTLNVKQIWKEILFNYHNSTNNHMCLAWVTFWHLQSTDTEITEKCLTIWL